MLVDNVINIMFVRGLWIRFLYMISKHHIYPVQKRPPKVNLFNFTFRGSHKINRGGARTDPSLYSSTKTNPRGKSGGGEGASHLQKEARWAKLWAREFTFLIPRELNIFSFFICKMINRTSLQADIIWFGVFDYFKTRKPFQFILGACVDLNLRSDQAKHKRRLFTAHLISAVTYIINISHETFLHRLDRSLLVGPTDIQIQWKM